MRSKERQHEFDVAYMKMALAFASLSYARRHKVGCIIVSEDDQIISQGFNGTPSGFDNNCEWDWCAQFDHKIEEGHLCIGANDDMRKCDTCNERCLKTKNYVIHAEPNAITKCAKSHNSTIGATMYVTLSPCVDCAKLIISSGIKKVVYFEDYNNPEGRDLLRKANIEVVQLNDID